ncbi:hypothetical protein JHK87_024269 [Glycine soja]|nr:hypothetical protein JHK87_024269 [Glycine soja]
MGHVFDGWKQGLINFPPTYKYEINCDRYVGERPKQGEKRRSPAWCDRILCLGKGIKQLQYGRAEIKLSDHRPVSSALLVEVEGLTSEKLTGPNLNSLRGFEVIDKIKYLLEEECPITVSCAGILAMVARHVVELVNTALSQGLKRILRSICPVEGRDNKSAPLDFQTPKRFGNHYFINILEGKGLLGSDNVLISHDLLGKITEQVWDYASNEKILFASFAKSMIRMGNINVLTGNKGEIRRNCRSGSPSIEDIEAYSATNTTKLDEAELAKFVPHNICLEVPFQV